MIEPLLSALLSGLPELPERFGNPLLRGSLVEIEALGAINWVPQTPGWYALALLLAGWSGRRLWHRTRRWLRNRYRREALKRLKGVQSLPNLEAINTLLKLTAMVASSRKEVAPLTGQDWCLWLQSRTPEPIFSSISMELLGKSIYQGETNDATPPIDKHPENTLNQGALNTLFDEVEGWILTHRDDHAPA